MIARRAAIAFTLALVAAAACVPDVVPTEGAGGTSASSSSAGGTCASSECGAKSGCLCAIGARCSIDADCVAGSCIEAVCQAPTVGRWTLSDTLVKPEPRFWHSMVYDEQAQRTLLIGGRTNGGSEMLADADKVYAFDGQESEWTAIQPPGFTAEWRVSNAVDFIPQLTFLFGGEKMCCNIKSNETWVYEDAIGFTQLSIAGKLPSPRTNAASAFDPKTRLWVIFGGYDENGASLRDTWLLDPAEKTWTDVASKGPPARGEAAMFYDPTSKKIILFGGADDEIYGFGYDDTWAFDTIMQTWTEVSIPLRPHARKAPAVAYDTRRHRAVIFGGLVASGFVDFSLDDTWEWDGTSWARTASGAGPSHRGRAKMAFDKRAGVSVLFGGAVQLSPDSVLGETWTYTVWGNVCSNDGQCDANYECADGVCCPDAKGNSCGTCRACNLPETLGQCSPLPAGTPCSGGTCDGQGNCG